jgi:hypothetical protein
LPVSCDGSWLFSVLLLLDVSAEHDVDGHASWKRFLLAFLDAILSWFPPAPVIILFFLLCLFLTSVLEVLGPRVFHFASFSPSLMTLCCWLLDCYIQTRKNSFLSTGFLHPSLRHIPT